jgi:hypothetical protein
MAKILALLGAKGEICELVHEYYDVTLRNYTIDDNWLTRKPYRFDNMTRRNQADAFFSIQIFFWCIGDDDSFVFKRS